MSMTEFASVGVFVVACACFFLGTGLFGVIFEESINGNFKSFTQSAWVVGGIVYAFTVAIMWRW